MKRVAVLTGWLVAVTAAVAGAEQPANLLKELPKKTVLAVQVRGLEQTQGRLVEMVEAMVPGTGQRVAQQIGRFKRMVFLGGQPRGLAADGRIMVALFAFPEPGQVPSGLILAETSDYQALRDSLAGVGTKPDVKVEKEAAGFEKVAGGRITWYFVPGDKYTTVTTDRAVAADVAAGKLARGLQGSKGLANVFQCSDVGIYVDMGAVRKRFGPAIDQARQQIAGFLAMASAMQPGANAEAIKAGREAMQTLIDGIFDCVNDTQVAAAGANFSKQGLQLALLADLEPESKTAARLAKFKPAIDQTVPSLPAGHHMYMGISDPQVYQALQALGLSMVQQFGPTGESLKKQLAAQMAAGPHAMAMALGLGKNGLHGVSVMGFERPADALEAELDTLEAMSKGQVPVPIKTVQFQVERDAAEHRGLKLTKVTMKMDFKELAGQPGAQIAAAQMKALFGEEGMVMWFAADKSRLYEGVGANLEQVKADLDRVLDGKDQVGQTEAFAEVWKRLPSKTTAVLVMDLPAFMTAILGQMMAAMGQPAVAVAAPQGPPSYLGVAGVFQPRQIRLQLWLPSDTISKMAGAMQALTPPGAP